MVGAVRPFVRAVQWRVGVGESLRLGTWGLCAALGVATALVVAERLLAVGVSVGGAVVVPVAVAGVLALGLGLARWPGQMAAALRADSRLGLEERLSSALAVGESPMAALVRADATRHVQGVEAGAWFPVRCPAAARALPLLAAVLVIAVLVPELDVLGIGEARRLAAARAGASGDPSRRQPRNGATQPAVVLPATPNGGTALAPESRGPAAVGPKRASTADDNSTGRGAQEAFVRKAAAPARPAEVVKLVESLAEARAAAEGAMAREGVPWRYRAVVKRYFSPEQDSVWPGR